MIHKAFRMKLYDNMSEEYKKRHNNIWPEMVEIIHNYGGRNYSIFLDEETNILFGYIELEDAKLWNKSGENAICQKWWEYMSDIMETNPDSSPVSVDLKEMFHLD